MHEEPDLKAALEAATLAGRVVLEAYADFQAIPNARADISTEADRQAQEAILGLLHARFPNDALCAEEQTPTLAQAARTGSRVWVVDPIDGTRGFAQKNGEFSIMVALVEGEKVALGVVLEPVPGRLTYARRGGGCWCRESPAADGPSQALDFGSPRECRVSRTAALASATLTQSHSRNPRQPSRPVQALRPARVLETYSAGIKLALVARGEADLYVNTYPNFHDWDICAGHILVEEAGGRVSGLRGETIRYGAPGAAQRHGLLASNAALHDLAVKGLVG